MSEPFVFTRLHLLRPVSLDMVSALLSRLAGTDVSRPLSFEVRASDDGIQHILGCAKTSAHYLRHLLKGSVPGVVFEAATRVPLVSAGRVEARQHGLPTGAPGPEQLTAAIYNVLAARKGGETLVLQVVLGRAFAPQSVRPDAPDPLQPITSRLWHGVKKASPDARRKLQEHAAEVRRQVVVRIGVDGPDAGRRALLARRLFGSLQRLEAIGVTLTLVREAPTNLHFASPVRARLELTASELAPLLGWPLGEQDLPGIEPLHPRRLPVPRAVVDASSSCRSARYCSQMW